MFVLGKWPKVTFGGSYSGALSAWARKLYPQHFAAAVALSAPMESRHGERHVEDGGRSLGKLLGK
jgi:hypothetical protein